MSSHADKPYTCTGRSVIHVLMILMLFSLDPFFKNVMCMTCTNSLFVYEFMCKFVKEFSIFVQSNFCAKQKHGCCKIKPMTEEIKELDLDFGRQMSQRLTKNEKKMLHSVYTLIFDFLR